MIRVLQLWAPLLAVCFSVMSGKWSAAPVPGTPDFRLLVRQGHSACAYFDFLTFNLSLLALYLNCESLCVCVCVWERGRETARGRLRKVSQWSDVNYVCQKQGCVLCLQLYLQPGSTKLCHSHTQLTWGGELFGYIWPTRILHQKYPTSCAYQRDQFGGTFRCSKKQVT